MSASRIRQTVFTACIASALGVAVNHGALAQVNTLCTDTADYPGYTNPPDICVYGGGSSLAARVYQNQFEGHNAVTDPTFATNYTSIGSGAGQKMFLQNNPADDTNNVTPAGSSIAFGASDATLSAAQISSWDSPPGSAGVADGQPVAGNLLQLPTFGTPIGIVYRSSAKQKGNGALQFTDAQLCGIFSGQTSLWSQLSGITTGSNTAPTGTITVVYRQDNSGTTFLLTQHLANVCPALGTFPITFSATQSFASLFPGSKPPSNFQADTNSSGVQTAVASTTGALGYLSPDYTLIAPLNANQPGYPAVAQVQNENDHAYYLPTSVNAQHALANVTAPVSGDSNPADYVPSVPNPPNFYPIVGFTTIDVAQCYANATQGGDLLELLQDYYQLAYLSAMLTQNGFSALPANLSAAVVNNLLTPQAAAPFTDLEDPSVCQSAGASGAGTFVGR
jgi:phosphate transport system substrate-binding protein